MPGSDEYLIDNPSVAAGAADPAAGNDVTGSSSPEPGNNYDPLTATRTDRVAALTQRLLGADTPVAAATEPPAEPEVIPGEPEPEPEPTPSPEPQVDIPDKFRLPDGSINPKFIQSYQNMESMFTKQAQQINDLTQVVINLQNQVLTNQTAPQYTPPEPPAPTPEELAAANEAWLERFYENPQKTLQDVIANTIQSQLDPILAPIMQDREFQQSVQTYSQQVAALGQKYPDLDQYRPAMQDILNAAQDPSSGLNLEAILDQDGAMEAIYLMAKGKTAQPPAPAPVSKTPEELLKDQNFLAQVVNNPEVQKMILANVQAQLKGEPKPPVVGARPGGAAPGLEPVSIKSTKDAARASQSYFQKVFGGTP